MASKKNKKKKDTSQSDNESPIEKIYREHKQKESQQSLDALVVSEGLKQNKQWLQDIRIEIASIQYNVASTEAEAANIATQYERTANSKFRDIQRAPEDGRRRHQTLEKYNTIYSIHMESVGPTKEDLIDAYKRRNISSWPLYHTVRIFFKKLKNLGVNRSQLRESGDVKILLADLSNYIFYESVPPWMKESNDDKISRMHEKYRAFRNSIASGKPDKSLLTDEVESPPHYLPVFILRDKYDVPSALQVPALDSLENLEDIIAELQLRAARSNSSVKHEWMEIHVSINRLNQLCDPLEDKFLGTLFSSDLESSTPKAAATEYIYKLLEELHIRAKSGPKKVKQ